MKKIIITNQLFFSSLLIITFFINEQASQCQIFSGDTISAGDTAQIMCTIGYITDSIVLTGRLTNQDWPNPEIYPDYQGDTLYTFKVETVNDTAVILFFNIPLGTNPGFYHLAVYDQYYCWFFDYNYIWMNSKPFFIKQPESIIKCPGETVSFETGCIGSDYIIYQWFYNNHAIEDVYERFLNISKLHLSDSGYYYCIANNDFGTDTSTIARLDFYNFPARPSQPEGISSLCAGISTTSYFIHYNPEVIEYTWILHPWSAGSINKINDTTAIISWNETFADTAKIYVTPQGEFCEGENSDTLDIIIKGPPQQPEICIVGIDEESGRNRIVWEKTDDPSIVSYLIYRETNQSDIYLLLDSIPSGEFSIYTDSGSLPGVVSQRYKISILDTCGNKSDLSNAHKTMHLTSNIGTHGEVNLIWEHYEGFAFLSYNIYRNTHPDSLEFLTSVPSNVSLYTDQNPPEGDIYYQIEVIHPEGCNPSTKSTDYSISRSNIIHVETTGIGTFPEISDFRIFPNPAHETLIIRLNEQTKPVVTRLYNSSGMQIREFYLYPGQNILNVSQLPEGIYFLRSIDNNESHRTGFVKLK